MGYRTKKEVLKSIVQRNRNGVVFYDAYIGYDPITKKQRRYQNRDLIKLKEDIETFYASIKSNGDLGVILKPYEILDARNAYKILYDNKSRMTLEEIVKEYFANTQQQNSSMLLGNVYDEYFVSIPNEQSLHKKAVQTRVGRWVDAFGRDRSISEITPKEVTAWLDSNYNNSNKTYNNYLSYIKSFLSWCVKTEHGYLEKNPIIDLSQRTIAYKEPEYLSAENVAILFKALERMKNDHPEYIAYATLSFFCGIRREEIIRMATVPDAANVNLEDETIRIAKPKGWTKGICPRAFRIMPNALQWLKSIDFAKAVISMNEYTIRFVTKIARENGIDIPKNAGRHTFITMHVAKFGEPSKTEAMVGTSKKMRVTNYCGLASHKEGDAYFNIIPSL